MIKIDDFDKQIKIDDFDKQIKIDEDFFKIPLEQWSSKEKGEEKNIGSRPNVFLSALLPVALILAIIAGIANYFLWAQVSSLNTEIKSLKSIINSIDVAGLKSRLITIETKLSYSSEENVKLKSDLVRLNSEIEFVKAKQEKFNAVSHKQPPAKKKTVERSPRIR